MIEIKSRTHTLRLFAKSLRVSDIFRVVLYNGYQGTGVQIPFYYFKSEGESCTTDLTLSMDEILSQMKSNTRNEIRRAEKQGCKFEIENNLKAFIKFYNDFCVAKGLNDFTNMSRLKKYKHLIITKCVHGNDIIAMHANVLDPESKLAFLLFSCSQRFDKGVDRKLIGWGNRFLHYKDLEYIKSMGFNLYDWSGTCSDQNDERHSISQFKLSFGGTPIKNHTIKSPLFRLLEVVRDFYVKFRK